MEERDRYGLSQDVLMWVYGLGSSLTAAEAEFEKRMNSIQPSFNEHKPRKKVDGRA